MHIENDEGSVAPGDTAADGCECISGGLANSGATCGERLSQLKPSIDSHTVIFHDAARFVGYMW